MSAGSLSPLLIATMSPGTSWSASSVMRWPSRNTLAAARQQQRAVELQMQYTPVILNSHAEQGSLLTVK